MPKQITLPYNPRPAFLPFHARKQRWACLVVHRRAGKTVACINELIRAAVTSTKKDARFAYVAPQYSQAKDIAWGYIKYYTAPIPGVSYNESELRVDFHNGARIRLYGTENESRLRGLYFDGAILDEYADIHPRVFDEILRPLLADRQGWAVFIGTPSGHNAFYTTYTKALADPQNWYAMRLKASESGILDNNELAAAKRDMTEDAYEQEFECFPPGTLVSTTRGNVRIEQIRPGDTVLTHRCRWRPVKSTMQRAYDGELVRIDAFGSAEHLFVTPEHPFLVYNKSNQSRTWVKARDLKAGDCLVTPKSTMATSAVSINFVLLAAWFISEGSVTGNHVSFSLNPNNQAELARVTALVQECGYRARWNGTSLDVCSTSLSDTLVSWCGSGAANKRIPFDIIAGHEEQFFDELMLGDGCRIERKRVGGKAWLYATISRQLAHDVQILSAALGRRANIGFKSGQQTTIQGRKVNTSDSYPVRISFGTKVNHGSTKDAFPSKYGMIYRVKSASSVSYSGPVYNLSVKGDESYVANGRAVHNCNFEAAIKGAIFGREMKTAEEANRITAVPYDPYAEVWTAWDLGVGDSTAIWFAQQVGREVRVIDYYENRGVGIDHYVKVLKDRPYNYARHLLPHDADKTELGSGMSVTEQLKQLGVRNTRVVKKLTLSEGISIARLFIPKCVFDRKKCNDGIEALKVYRYQYDALAGVNSRQPVHNFASHAADAFRYLAIGFKPDSLNSGPLNYPHLALP